MGVLIWPTAANFLLLSCYTIVLGYPDNVFVLMIANHNVFVLMIANHNVFVLMIADLRLTILN